MGVPKVTKQAFDEINEKLIKPYLVKAMKNPDEMDTVKKARNILTKYVTEFEKDQPVVFDWLAHNIQFYMELGIPMNPGTLVMMFVIFNRMLKIQGEIDEVNGMLNVD